ncbi:DsbA family protein [Microbacterium fluvii]|uniref:DsbA family protein n=1 Tax=Microbacterium fluvii TaxID=415215 RepID=A0ABW2HCF8_9MICO|nr:DsbA family protein [Microbacterium fluvii]MCU4671765.1 DsbA family protein [Microbacterium fluvii]
MSSDESPTPSNERREAVREKAMQVHTQQSRARMLRRGAIGVALVAAVAVAAVVVTSTVASSVKPNLSPAEVEDDGFAVTSFTGVAGVTSAISDDATPTPTETPAADETPAAAEPTQAAVDIRVYVDYLSAGSGTFQQTNVQQLAKWVDSGAVTLSYHPVAMLTAKSNGTKYSLRAASAVACVATYAPDSLSAYNHTLLTQQPDVDSAGYTDTELADMAQASGAKNPKVVRACIEDEKYLSWAKEATERALNGIPDTDGVVLTGTPTVLVNGVPYIGALDDAQEFSQFVLTSASDAYYQATPTPTPSPTD